MRKRRDVFPTVTAARQTLRKPVSPEPISSSRSLAQRVLSLQRSVGNVRVRQLLQADRLRPQQRLTGIQPKMIVGGPGDQFEQEADRVAREVVNTPSKGIAQSAQRAMTSEEDKVQRQPGGNEDWKEKEMELLQRQPESDPEEIKLARISPPASAANALEAPDDLEARVVQSRGYGHPLPDGVRAFMEPRFGADFTRVRVHTNDDAVRMNRDIGAKAFTRGSDIYYGAGQDPANLELTAHELTHVVQQTGGRRLQATGRERPATCAPGLPVRSTGSTVRAHPEPRTARLVQRTIGDGHDFPPASRFSANAVLEGVFDNERVVQSGSSGAAVTLVQQALIALNYPLPRFGADGQFGDETKRAVDAFQRDVGLGVDGRVGFRTIDFLDKRDRGAEVAPPVRPVVANAPFRTANAIVQPGAAPSIALTGGVWGLTFPENVQVTIDVFDNGGVWQPVLTGVTGNYSLQTRLLPGVAEVTGPAGNTTAGNYCAQINDLDALGGANWYMLAAVLEHERIHARQFRTALIHPSVITPLETAIEAITTPVGLLTPNATMAEFFIRIDPRFTAALTAAQANWLARILVLVAGDHTAGGRTDTEEHRIVDPMRRRICQHARANGWPACPPLCP